MIGLTLREVVWWIGCDGGIPPLVGALWPGAVSVEDLAHF